MSTLFLNMHVEIIEIIYLGRMKKNIMLMLSLLTFIVTVHSQGELKWKTEVTSITTVKHDFDKESKGLIVLTGSSSARMWKSVDETFPDYNVKNHGFGGSQMFELLFFLDELVVNDKPNKVLIYEGDNDINAGKKSEEIMVSTAEVISRIKEALPETEIYLISTKPSISRWALAEKYIDLNKRLKAYSEVTVKVTYIDVWTPMLNKEGTPIEDLFIEDGLHMNKKGYKIWEDVIGPIVK